MTDEKKKLISEKERQAIIWVLDSYGIIKKAGVIADEIISDLSELRNAEKPSEDLVQQIESSLNKYRRTDSTNRTALDWGDFNFVSKEIANLVAKREAELLDTLESIANAPNPFNEFEYSVFHSVAKQKAEDIIKKYQNP